jgi:hypothetical protein
MVNSEERIAGLLNWGYTPIAADFIATAALGSGYFLNRQARSAIGSNSSVLDMTDRLRRQKFASVRVLNGGTKLYQLISRRLYEALGEPAANYNRVHSPATWKNRVMGLDVTLKHSQDGPHLLTSTERLNAFSPQIVPVAHLPHKGCVVFPDRFPVWQSGDCWTFAYIDSGMTTPNYFARWLSLHSRLFAALDSFRVLYCAQYPELEPRIRGMFEAAMLRDRPQDYDPQIIETIRYFGMRADEENARWNAFSVDRVVQYRKLQEHYSWPKIEALYRAWKQTGDSAVIRASTSGNHPISTSAVLFEADFLTTDYSGFGQPKGVFSRDDDRGGPTVEPTPHLP